MICRVGTAHNARFWWAMPTLPLTTIKPLDKREDVPHGGYRNEYVDINVQGKVYKDVRTYVYVVVNKLAEELELHPMA
jgi:hypothetical protein